MASESATKLAFDGLEVAGHGAQIAGEEVARFPGPCHQNGPIQRDESGHTGCAGRLDQLESQCAAASLL